MILKILLALALALAVLAGVILWLGGRVPERHRIALAVQLKQSPDVVFDTISDIASATSWRDKMTASLFLEPSADGKLRFQQADGNGKITYRIEESSRPNLFVTRIDDPSLPFGGAWTISITANGSGAEVEIIEDGEIRSRMFRFFARYVFGYYRSAESYLAALERKFGEKTPIRRIVL